MVYLDCQLRTGRSHYANSVKYHLFRMYIVQGLKEYEHYKLKVSNMIQIYSRIYFLFFMRIENHLFISDGIISSLPTQTKDGFIRGF